MAITASGTGRQLAQRRSVLDLFMAAPLGDEDVPIVSAERMHQNY